ncbi:MAG: hypothetical protein K0R24_222 [Gammaproteobacteria bacterium]|jgi:hypothetical protein|nr:hypothetical protein [Gammaproteobacteria bacterium]
MRFAQNILNYGDYKMFLTKWQRMTGVIRGNSLSCIAFCLAAMVFFSWYPLQLLLGGNSYLDISTVGVFKSTYSWMPLLHRVANGLFFPSHSSLLSGVGGAYFYPYITVWASGIIFALWGYSGLILIGQWLLPLASFFIFTRIFRRYLSELWSVTIAFVAFIAFSDWPFRHFLMGLLSGKGWLDLGTYQSLEILHFPIPAFSIFAFLALFYVSTQQVRLTGYRITTLTACWALLSQVHIIDALYGLTFWFTYFSIRFFRQNKKFYGVFSLVVFQLFIVLLIISPLIYAFFKDNAFGVSRAIDLGMLVSSPVTQASLYYYFAYFILPLILMMLIYFIQRIDFYEIVFKFWHVYMLILIEFILVSISIETPIDINLFVLQNRIAFFFLHFYYYVPFLYYATRSPHTYFTGVESVSLSSALRNGLSKLFSVYNSVYLPISIALLIIFSSVSAYNSFFYQKNTLQPILSLASRELNELKSYFPSGSVLVSETPIVNLLSPILPHAQYSTLWANRFIDDITMEEAIDRLVLYARIYNWPSEKFISFMLPGVLQQSRNALVKVTPECISTSGIGYWLVFHNRYMSSSELLNYSKMLKDRYRMLNIKQAMHRFHVERVFAYNVLPKGVLFRKAIKIQGGYIYLMT